jgi:recombinational DNA repair ATPase RecF
MTVDRSLFGVVRERLTTAELSALAKELIEAQLGDAPAGDAVEASTASGGRTYLSSIEVTGFRGIGPTAVLDIEPGPGLTVVAGRNGAGKSSFADALEYLLTGTSFRWQGKGSAAWKTGWANLHHDGDRSVAVSFVTEGSGADGSADAIELRHVWPKGAELDGGNATATAGERATSVEELGWGPALDLYRPFLPYGELDSMLSEGPSRLYDALAGILGLEDLVALSAALADQRKQLDAHDKATKAALVELHALFDDSDDPRATRCAAALTGRTWNLDEVEDALRGSTESADPTSEINRARQLINLAAPSPERVDATVTEFDAARAAVQQWQGTDADRSLRTARLLEQALDLHEHAGDSDCPMCGQGRIDAAWRDDAQRQISELRQVAAAADGAQRRLEEARSSVSELIRLPDVLVSEAVTWPVDVGALRAAWLELAAVEQLPDDQVGAAVRTRTAAVQAAAAGAADAADAWIRSHEDSWRPIAEPLTAWLLDARTAVAIKPRVTALKDAEKWLSELSDSLRAERFAPIESRAVEMFTTMRAASNVSLDRLQLVGKANRRRLELDVAVDGQDGAGVAVMSQGELNALALSLFLPRATLPDSPFGFVVIDDPVQSMDPSRVDGLARALEKVAADRQVIVFTHDDRLPTAIRSLGIEATILQVQRRKNSEIEVRPVHDPAKQYLSDANFIRKMQLPPQVQQAVVPALLRQAIEAAAQVAVRRRRLRGGATIDDVDEELADLETVELVGLVLLDRKADKSDVYDAVRDRFSAEWATALSECNSGAHNSSSLNLEQLSTRAGKLARKLQDVA